MEPDPGVLVPKSLCLGAFQHQIPQKLPIAASYLANEYQRDQATDAALILDRVTFSNPASVSAEDLKKLVLCN